MKKSLAVVAGAMILLCLVLLLQKRTTHRLYGDEFALDSFELREVNAFRVIQGPDTLSLQNLGEHWAVAADSFPVDSLHMQNALKALFALQGKEKVSTTGDSARLAAFGFGPETSTFIEWTLSSGERKAIELGGPADAQYQTIYWKWPGEPGVYRTMADLRGVTADADAWKSREVFPPFLYEGVQSVEVDWRDSLQRTVHYRLERTSDTAVRLVEPDTMPIPRRSAAAIYVQTPQFAVDEFVAVGDENVGRAGVDTPTVEVKIGLKTGEMYRLRTGRAFGGFYYAQHPKHGHFIKIAQWRLNFFRKTLKEILHPPVLSDTAYNAFIREDQKNPAPKHQD